MKKLLSAALAATLALNLCACSSSGQAEPSPAPDASESQASTGESTSETSDGLEDLESLGDIEVDKNLFDVVITMPADLVGETTQEELDQQAADSGVHSITLNEDGSATYVMSKEQHKKLLEDTRQSIRTSLDEMVGSEDYPNITSVEANDDFTSFTVTTTSTEVSFTEAFSVIGLYMYGGIYGIFSGETPDNIHVDFVNADTGEIIDSSDSQDMEESE